MPKRSRNASDDPNVSAFNVLSRVMELNEEPKKNPAAVALGRLGGLKGGKARAAKMSKKARIASAKRAADVRWGNG